MKKERKHIDIEKKLLEESSNLKVPAKKSKKEVWAELSDKLNNNETERKKLNLSVVFKYAAAIVLLISVSLFFLNKETNIKTDYAQTKSILLPDGSSVILQAGSEISFNEKKWNQSRNIKLTGEAFFSVKKVSKFNVTTPNGTIQVLGTQFNVITRNNKFEVACVTGKVSVQLRDRQDKKILTKGLYTKKIAKNKLSEPANIDISIITARKQGKFAFNKAALEDVFDEIERQFDVKIKYTGRKNRLFTGYFSNKDLDKALRMVCIPMELDYQIDNKLVILKDLAKSRN